MDKYRDKIGNKIQICTNLSVKTFDFFVSTSTNSNKNPFTFGTDEEVSDSKT